MTAVHQTAPERTAGSPAGPAAVRRSRRRRPVNRAKVAAWCVIVVVGLFALLPVYWMIVTSVTPDSRVFQFPPQLFPTSFTLDHFADLAQNPRLLKYLANSLIVSSVTAVLTVLVAAYTAYSFSKFRYRGRSSLMYLVLASQMFPQAVLLITLYTVFSAVGLLNTYLALILSFTTFTMPLCIWMLKGIFDTVPNEVLESAKVDGAPQWVILHRILIPISAPGLVAAGLFAFIRGWNDFIFALTLAGPDKQTLPPGLVNTYVGEFQSQWPELMAASIVVSIPVVVGFIALQRYLVAGIAGGAVKG